MKFVNQILREGLQQGATDIHFEPLGHDLRIRYRIDGVLQEVPVPQRIKMLQDSLISRLKIMSGLDIAERRRPQDGRIALEIAGAPIDVRDPLAVPLRQALEAAGPDPVRQVEAALAFEAIFGRDLRGVSSFQAAIVEAHGLLLRRGAREAARAMTATGQ
jgi:type II secretory ATPase GspE/PulE/Tfp pilus assembly ATPase PilB-like protein